MNDISCRSLTSQIGTQNPPIISHAVAAARRGISTPQKIQLSYYSVGCAVFGIIVNVLNSTTVILAHRGLLLFGCVLNVPHNLCTSGTIPSMYLKELGRSVLIFYFSLGSYALLENPAGSNKLYPAEIISRSPRGSTVNLRWYSGNLLHGGNYCADFHIPLSCCLDALFRDLRARSHSVSAVIQYIAKSDHHQR